MKSAKTLRQCFTEISVISFISITVVMFTCFTLYSIKKTKVTEESIQTDLNLNLNNQVNMFLPSFLLPEQKQGMNLLLERIKKDESLDMAIVFSDKSNIPKTFADCNLSDTKAVTCASSDMSATAVIAPLKDSDEHFGYFLKAKKNASAASIMGLIQFAGIILLILGITFILIYYFISRLIAKTMPLALDNLVRWIESEINGKKDENIPLYFKELGDIRVKISEVIDRYNRSRDQAIIGQVTSGIMHDIKTPLQSIVTAAHLVSEQEEHSPKRLARLENLFRMCANNLPLIGEIIESTLDGNRNIQIQKSKGNLRETVEASVRYTKEFSRLRKVSVEIDSPEEVIAEYDSLQFVRVMNNLLKNGIEAASESENDHPTVRISINQAKDQTVKLTIEDSGSGFAGPPEKVFRAFGTTKMRGTGLGLLITKKIIEAHDGVINASNSSVYGGARMEVILPTCERESV